MRKLLLIALVAACASNKRPVGPPLTQVPSVAVDSMCARLRAEGLSAELVVMDRSRPILTPASLYGLGEISVQNARPSPESLKPLTMLPAVAVEKPQTCAARFVGAKEAARVFDIMTLEFSAPIENPYVKRQMGTLVRMSLGGESATWYWVALTYYKDRWVASMPASVSVMELR